MLTVEDVLDRMATRLRFSADAYQGLLDTDWHRSFLASVAGQVQRGRPLSSEQSRIVLKLIERVGSVLAEVEGLDPQRVQALLATPQYRAPPYPSSHVRREVRHLGANLLGLRFKYNELILTDLRQFGVKETSNAALPRFDRASKLWIVPVTRTTLGQIERLINVHRFETDASVDAYLALCRASQGQSATVGVNTEFEVLAGTVCDNEVFGLWVTQVAGGEYV